MNGTCPDNAQSELDLNMNDPRTDGFSVSDVDAAVPADFASYMWQSTAILKEKPLDPGIHKQYERQWVFQSDKNDSLSNLNLPDTSHILILCRNI